MGWEESYITHPWFTKKITKCNQKLLRWCLLRAVLSALFIRHHKPKTFPFLTPCSGHAVQMLLSSLRLCSEAFGAFASARCDFLSYPPAHLLVCTPKPAQLISLYFPPRLICPPARPPACPVPSRTTLKSRWRVARRPTCRRSASRC